MSSHNSTNVLVEPHQKHVIGQSDLETALHTLLDHLRGPFLAMKSDATEFCHIFNDSIHIGAHTPKNRNGGYARIFVPRIDMRETSNGYFIDIELPGVHDASSLTIAWRSERELLVEGAVERPAIIDVFAPSRNRNGDIPSPNNGNSRHYYDLESSQLRGSTAHSSPPKAPAYVVADQANGFEKNEDLYPSDKHPAYVVADEANGFEKNEDLYPSVSEHARSQANPLTPSNQASNSELFPRDIVDGVQLDEGDSHRVQVPTHHLPNGDVVTIGERYVGRFMRCFVFPHGVDVKGLRSGMADGLLRIGVPKAKAKLAEHGYHISEFGRVD